MDTSGIRELVSHIRAISSSANDLLETCFIGQERKPGKSNTSHRICNWESCEFVVDLVKIQAGKKTRLLSASDEEIYFRANKT